MPLTLITGRANSGKSGEVYGLVRSAVERGQGPTLLVPGTIDARLAREELASRGPVIGTNVATFDEIVRALWLAHGDERRIVTEAQRGALVSRAVEVAELDAIATAAAREGFQREICRLAAGISHERRAPSRAGGVAGELDNLLGAYAELLGAARCIEAATATALLSEALAGDWFTGPLIAHRFADLTPSQERLLMSASGAGVEVAVALTWEEDFPATRALDALVARLDAAGAQHRVVPAREYPRSREIAYLEANLFRDMTGRPGAPRLGDVRISESCGEEAEADRIAAEVAEALAEGTEPGRIAVVFREPARHVRALRHAFDSAGIPASYDVLVPAGSAGLGRALTHAARFARDGDRTSLVAFLRTPYSGLDRGACERLERQWRRNRAVDASALVGSIRSADPTAGRLVERALRLIGERVSERTALEWKDLADSLLRNAYGCNASLLDADGMADCAVHRALCRTIDDFVGLAGVAADGRRLVESLGAMRIPLDAERAAGVRVLSALRARGQRFDVLVLGGLAAGDFPPRASEDPFASEQFCTVREAFGIAPPAVPDQDAERLLFYLVVSRGMKRLVLSRQIADSDGSPLRGSWLLDELLDLYRTPGSTDVPPETVPPVTTLGFEESGLARGAPSTIRRELRTAIRTGGHAPAECEARRLDAVRRATCRVPGLADPDVLGRLAGDRVFSVTEIESYLSCPYSWFHDRVISPRPFDATFDARVQGALIHDALKQISERMEQATGDRRVIPGRLPEALQLAEAVVDRLLEEEPPPASFSEEAARVVVKRQVVGFVRSEAEFLPAYRPAFLEWEFGSDEPEQFEGFALRGRIDRIDEGPDGSLVLVDYKKGRVDSSFGRKKLHERGRVQLALYARVAERRLGRPVVGGLYRSVTGRNVTDKLSRGFFDPAVVDSPGLVSTDRATPEEIRDLMDAAEHLAREAVDGMRAGSVPAEPRSDRSCTYCAVAKVCPGAARWA